ncbi:GNAT family N-acetyltransferase [Actinokineospora sp. 24-640]
MLIRAVAEKDHEELHAILTSPHVARGSTRVPLSPLWQSRERFTPKEGLYQVVAEADGQVIGFGELVTYPGVPRYRHRGEVNLLATREDRARQGVGRALLGSMIDVADNWLNLTRLGLVVFTENTGAIQLYESAGFHIEGTMSRSCYGDGGWQDAHIMARLRPSA